MTTDITNLMQQAYDYFLNLFHQTDGAASQDTFLTFEPVGTPISPGMFKLHAADTTYSQALATEVFSTLVNIVPAINADVFQPTGKAVDDFYTMLLSGSQVDPQSGDSALFDALKRPALEKLDQITLGSLQGPFQFHPAYAMPRDWYDPTVEANWTAHTFSTGTPDPPPPAGEPPPAPTSVSPDLTGRPWTWRVLPSESRPVLNDSALLEHIALAQPAPGISARLTERIATPLIAALAARTLSIETVPEARATGPEKSVSMNTGMALLSAEQFAPEVAAQSLQISPTIVQAVRLQPLAIALEQSDTVRAVNQVDDTGIIAVHRPWLVREKLTQIVDTTQREPVESHSLTLSLKYCMVTINRPWLSQAFLTTRDWFLPGFAAGGISDGTRVNNSDPFPALSVACLLVKDLHITADWAEISGVAQQSAAFGPFSLIGQTVEQAASTLTVSGIQIIGWICQIMPLLPPSAVADA